MCRHQCTKQTVNTSEDRVRIQDNYPRLEKKGFENKNNNNKKIVKTKTNSGKEKHNCKNILKKKDKKKTHE